MISVDRLCRQYHFAITGQFQVPGAVAFVQNVYPPDFNAIRTDGDAGAQGDAMIRTLEFHLVWIKKDFLVFRFTSHRLAGGRTKVRHSHCL